MSKAILISIKPKYVADILNGKKTIEIRKTMPKCDLPIDVYIYCTKEENLTFVDYRPFGGCAYENTKLGVEGTNLSGKVVAKFTLNKVEKFDLIEETKLSKNDIDYDTKYNEIINKHNDIAKKSCLKITDLVSYCDTKALGVNQKEMVGYAWHISNLVIFDKPKELSEFKSYKKVYKCDICPIESMCIGFCKKETYLTKLKTLTKAPQSYMFIESEE